MPGFIDDLLASIFGGGNPQMAAAGPIPAVPQGVQSQPVDPAVLQSNPLTGRSGNIDAGLAGLSQLFGNIAAQTQRRPLGQPAPVGGSVSDAIQRQLQLTRQTDQQAAYDRLVSSLPPDRQSVFRALGPTAGGAALASQFTRDNQSYTLGPGQRRYDANGRVIAEAPERPFAPIVDRNGNVFDPNIYMRSTQPGAQGAAAPAAAPGPPLPGVPGARFPDVAGAAPPNNPGGIRGQGRTYRNFATPAEGQQAMEDLLRGPLYFGGGRNTVATIIPRWAPRGDGANNPELYTRNVASWMGVDPNQPLDPNDPQTMRALTAAITRQEGVAMGGVRRQDNPTVPRQYAQAGGVSDSGGPPSARVGVAPPPAPDTSGGTVTGSMAPPTVSPELQALISSARTPPASAAAPPQPLPMPRPGVAQAPPAGPPPIPGMVGRLPQRDPQDNTLVAVPDATSPTGYRYTPRAQAVGQPAAGPSGTVVRQGPNGQMEVLQGPGVAQGAARAGMAQPTVNRIEEQITNNTARLQRLQTIAERFRPEFLQIGPQIQNWTAATLDRLGANLTPEQQRRVQEFSSFRSAAYTELNQTLREMSGTAVTESEMGRLLMAAPDPANDSPRQFQAKLRDTIEATRLANARLHYYRTHGLNPTFRGAESGPIPLENMRAVIAGREEALMREYSSLPAEQLRPRVRAQLMQEFGLN